MPAKGLFTKLFGDFGHTFRTILITTAAAAIATYSWNKFIKEPVGTLADVAAMRTELNQLKADYAEYRAAEKERWIKRQAEMKEFNDKISATQVDVAWLKGRVK